VDSRDNTDHQIQRDKGRNYEPMQIFFHFDSNF
jgi:hypothetical protein